jgi:hypothetical protein
VTTVLISVQEGQAVEVAMTMNFLPSCNPSGQIEPSDSKPEGLRAHAAECRELADRCWQEESKRRYEELARYWLELAEQRQRSA